MNTQPTQAATTPSRRILVLANKVKAISSATTTSSTELVDPENRYNVPAMSVGFT
jgi:hypothetical protein